MNKDEFERVGKKIDGLINKNFFNGKKVFLFGSSDHTRQVVQILREYQIEPEYVLDNDNRKRHNFCAGIEIILPEDVEDILNEKHIYLMYSYFWREMQEQLLQLGVSQRCILSLVKKDKNLPQRLYESYTGKKIYERIQKRYGNLPILLCPYTGTGDIYLIGTFLNQYLKKEMIDDFVFVVISNACKKVADIFHIKNVEVLRYWNEGEYLIRYYLLCSDKVPLTVLNDSWPVIHTNKLEWFRGYKNWHFMELFRTFVFNLPDSALPEKPVFDNVDKELDRIFEENRLQAGRTVIIAPYATTLADLPDSFWAEIVDDLKKKGYIVCTNCGGPSEQALSDTIPVSFSLTIAPQFVSRAGFFIGVRSGLCDVISAAEAKKIILYDRDNWFYNSSAYQYFSLNHMKLCEDAIEIEYDNQQLEQCIEKVKHYF